MPTAETHIATDRASRYLGQLCRHLNTMGGPGHRPSDHGGDGRAAPTVEHVDWSDTYGTIRFATGLCTLRATPDALALRVDADDQDTLLRLQTGLARRIETIGRRDQLTATWHRTDAATPTAEAATVGTESTPPAAAGKRRRRGRLSTVGLAALAALVILGHAGLFGGALAVSVLDRWGLPVVGALIAVKVVLVGVHLLGGRVALRRGRALLPHRWQRHSPGGHSPSGHRSRRRTSSVRVGSDRAETEKTVLAADHHEPA